MAFAGSNLKLSDVTTAYGVTSLLNMRGKTSYGSSSDPSTGIQVGSANVNLSSFFNRFITSSGTFGSQEAFAQAGSGGHGVEARCGFNTVSYTVTNGLVTRLNLNFYLNDTKTGTAVSSGSNSPAIQIFQNGTLVFQDRSTGSKTVTMNASTFTINVSGNASNNLGDQASASGSWTYNVITTGVSGPI